jgi:hypothetical protein
MLFYSIRFDNLAKGIIMRLNKNVTRKGLRMSRLGCPLTLNRTPWCYGLCIPDEEKKGYCGRVSPHALKGRTSTAIENFKRRNPTLRKQTVKQTI